MREDKVIKRLEASGNFLKIILWPIVVGIALLYLAPAIKRKIDGSENMELGVAGFSAKFGAAEAAASMVAAQLKYDSAGGSAGRINPANVAEMVTGLSTPESQAVIKHTVVLWVDDNPNNNTYELNALRALSFDIETSTSTEDALGKMQRSSYDLIISDIRREPNQRAGFEMLTEMRRTGITTPVVFYTATAKTAQRTEAISLGAKGVAAAPEELLRLITDVLPRVTAP